MGQVWGCTPDHSSLVTATVLIVLLLSSNQILKSMSIGLCSSYAASGCSSNAGTALLLMPPVLSLCMLDITACIARKNAFSRKHLQQEGLRMSASAKRSDRTY
eukprot:784705-Amphidinium_carterae.1